MQEELEEIKNYLRIDFDDDDSLLNTIILAGKEYIKNAIGYIDMDKPSFKVLLYTICADLYERRSYLIDKAIHTNKIINGLILQLQLLKED
ncbi:head-tail connector protein [[Clostridium] colinum]|uniref:head-tail connector protein n=1 Tax=[Clostridium] colinum TaxID=36835 RepID=UPI002023E0E3|nr:head-tail connector protein [[Clostridium] colinum]